MRIEGGSCNFPDPARYLVATCLPQADVPHHSFAMYFLTCSNRLLQTFWETGSCTLICTCLQMLRCRRCATGCCHKRWPPTARAACSIAQPACSAMPSSSQTEMSLSSRSTSCWSVGSPTATISASRYGRKAAWGGAGGQQPTRPDQATSVLSGSVSMKAQCCPPFERFPSKV